VASGFEYLVTHLGQTTIQEVDSTGFARGVAAVTPLIETELRRLQKGGLEAVHRAALDPASDVHAAAVRVGGVQNLLRGYLSLGLPQALATDDGLRGLVAGDAANALLHPYGDDRTNTPAPTVPGQVANYLERAVADVPAQDPIDVIGLHLNRHSRAFETAIRPYVTTGRAAGQSPADGGRLDQGNPLVTSTIDRLELSRAVLAAHLARPPRPAAPAPAPAPAPSGDVEAPADPATASDEETDDPPVAARPRARLVREPRARGNAIRYTVRCLSGTCRLGATVTAGRRTVGRAEALTLRAGTQRTVTVGLNRAGRSLLARRGRLRVTVRVTLAGAARPLAEQRLSVRR
jgi:hypothetical protein